VRQSPAGKNANTDVAYTGEETADCIVPVPAVVNCRVSYKQRHSYKCTMNSITIFNSVYTYRYTVGEDSSLRGY
jgi:hypothetical protein